jgi:Surface antigen variable number repeat
MSLAALLLAALVARQPPVSPAQVAPPAPTVSSGLIAGIRVRGNHTTPDAEVVRIAEVSVGAPFNPSLPDAVKERLDRSGRFRSVEVLERYQSLSDSSAILLVIVVEERAGVTVGEAEPGPMRRLRAHMMWLPVLGFEDGYGFTYGARVSLVDLGGPRSHLSAPLTWGGERRAAAEFERTFEHGPLTRLAATAGVWRREHPALGVGDRRAGASVAAERAVTPWLRAGVTGSTVRVHFGQVEDTLRTAGVQATLDTRLDPAFPRNAVYASVGWERLWFDRSPDTSRVTADARGFVGLFGQVVLAARVQPKRAGEALPVF